MATRVLSLFAALAILAGCGGGSSDEDAASRTVRTYYDAFAKGDGNRLCDQLDAAGTRKLLAGLGRYLEDRSLPCDEAVQQAAGALKKAGVAVTDVEVQAVELHGATGTVHVRLNGRETVTTPVVRRGSRWLVTAREVKAPANAAPQNVSREEATRRANALCRRGAQDIRALGSPPSDPAGVRRYANRALAVSQPIVDALKTLRPPYEDREVFDRYVAAFALRAELASEAADAASSGDRVQARDLARRLDRAGKLARFYAGQYALEDCG